MRISAKTEYAAIAMLELAIRYGASEPVRIRTIAETHGVPSRFLVQILLQLKGAGLVASTRGAAGGYRLAKSPQEITLGEIMAIVEGPPKPISSSADLNTPVADVLVECWQKVADVECRMLSDFTLSDLVDQVRGRTEAMYYI
jgi:Rrf2 family protein